MSREAFPQLPPEALTPIENFPPELHASTEEQLLALSHRSLLSEGELGHTPIPSAELGEEHQPHIDSVAQHMERTSQLLGAAHSELGASGVDERGVNFEQLAEKAKEIAIRSAKEAKQAGDVETAVKALETLLVIESLRVAESPDPAMQSKSIARTIVGEGLATEFVEATHETFGLVALQEGSVAPLNAIAQSSPQLLRAASSLEFTDDFSDVATAEPKSDVSDLSCGDLLALAKMAETEHPDTTASRDLLRQALKSAAVEKVEPADLVETLSQARELSLQDELGVALPALRLRRRAGDSTYRINDRDTTYLDETIVKLVQRGESEVARGLISSSPADSTHLRRAAERETSAAAEESQLTATLEKLCQDKQGELRHHLQSMGVSESAVNWVIQTAADPDSAATIPIEFWQKLEADYSLQETLVKGGDDLARSAEALSAIDSSGLAEHSDLLLQNVLRLGDDKKASKYLASIKGALDALGGQQESEDGQNIDVRTILTSLASFEDPIAALEAAKTLYGAGDHQKELGALYALVHPQYGSELAEFRPEDIAALVILRNYCATTGIEAGQLAYVSASLLGDSDPIGRAQSITEGLRLANVTADTTNRLLFFEITKRGDPISLGRAISVLEPLLAAVNDTVREGILKETIRSRSPEQTASLIVRTQKELQNQQLTLEDIGVGRLAEVMLIVDSSEASRAIERYCSNWKVQRECEEAFQKYLQPVRESGGRKTAGIEQRPKLADLPEMRTRFERLGITPELAEGMLDSWLTYSALSRRLYKNGEIRSEVTAEDIDNTLAEQGEQLVTQAEALTNYVEYFGIEEAIELANTFGIYNFIRYKPGQLHNQLLYWKFEKQPARNIVVSARADWNDALSDAGTSSERVLGEAGLFCFEVNDKTELAKVAVAIGNRERAMGREPEAVNAVHNFIIEGHANPDGILLGTRGQKLETTDYLRDPLNGQRANTYRRHLGSKFRVILKACSTAGEVAYGKNIAEAISDHHGVRVEGSKVITSGGIIIDPDGTVRFNNGNMPSTVYM